MEILRILSLGLGLGIVNPRLRVESWYKTQDRENPKTLETLQLTMMRR
jgi:hypothetical protein